MKQENISICSAIACWCLGNILFSICHTNMEVKNDQLVIGDQTSCMKGDFCIPNTIKENLQKLNLPSTIIIGSRKCGTRAILEMLSVHPSVKTFHREGHYFDNNNSFILGENWYRSMAPTTISGYEVVVEKTPSYLVSRYVPKRIFHFNPSAKFIVTLRNPVDRLMSDYLQLQKSRTQKKQPLLPSFEHTFFNRKHKIQVKETTEVKIGRYAMYLSKWFTYFSRDQFLFVNGDQLIKEPYFWMKKIERFLSIKPYFTPESFVYNKTKGFYCWQKNSGFTCLGKDKGTKHFKIQQKERRILDAYYKPYNNKLFKMIGETFYWT